MAYGHRSRCVGLPLDWQLELKYNSNEFLFFFVPVCLFVLASIRKKDEGLTFSLF
jgi:hypothetical protein